MTGMKWTDTHELRPGNMLERECLDCGMLHQLPAPSIIDRKQHVACEKCDASLMEQGDGSTLTVDIAHQRETVNEALDKLDQALEQAWSDNTSQLRLIVGGGAIRDAVLGELYFRRSRGVVLDYTDGAGARRGALMIRIR